MAQPPTPKTDFALTGEIRRPKAPSSIEALLAFSNDTRGASGDNVLTYGDDNGDLVGLSTQAEFDDASCLISDLGFAVFEPTAHPGRAVLCDHIKAGKKNAGVAAPGAPHPSARPLAVKSDDEADTQGEATSRFPKKRRVARNQRPLLSTKRRPQSSLALSQSGKSGNLTSKPKAIPYTPAL